MPFGKNFASNFPMERQFEIIICLGWIAVHLTTPALRFLERIPRSRWLSFGGGTSVAYVFAHLLPDLGKHQERYEASGAILFFDNHIYFVALLGLITYYGMERMAKCSRGKNRRERGSDSVDHKIFWVHLSALFGHRCRFEK